MTNVNSSSWQRGSQVIICVITQDRFHSLKKICIHSVIGSPGFLIHDHNILRIGNFSTNTFGMMLGKFDIQLQELSVVLKDGNVVGQPITKNHKMT